MLALFKYNWQVRDEWLLWCESLPQEQLLELRVGGAGGFLQTLFHVIDVEASWIGALREVPDVVPRYEDYAELSQLKALSEHTRPEILAFVHAWSPDMEDLEVTPSWTRRSFTYGEVLRHLIAHEIHHIGQMSVWARELDLSPPSANFIDRKL